eukprot:3702352-Amphidinium_carterae.1
MVRSTRNWMALPKLQVLQLRLSYAVLWMQGGGETRRCRTTGRHGPKACPLILIQALGEHRTSAQRGEGSGDPFS